MNKNFRKNINFIAVIPLFALLLSVSGVSAASGELDPAFGTGGAVITDLGGSQDTGLNVVFQTDGKILLSGYEREGSSKTPAILRFFSDGTPDSAFGANGVLTPVIGVFEGTKIAVQSDGKLLVAGTQHSGYGNAAVARYSANGTALDSAFGTDGLTVFLLNSSGVSINDIALQSDGKILLLGTQEIGNYTNMVVFRFNTDGTPDSTFVANGLRILDVTDFPNNRYNNGSAIVVQSDGRIILTGYMMDNDGNGQIALARLNIDGSMDTSAFGTNGKGTTTTPLENFIHAAGALVLQSDEKILLAGSVDDSVNINTAIARFNTDGSPDTTFGGTGIVTTDLGAQEYASSLALQSDGKIVLAGKKSNGSASDVLLLRYNANGTPDNTFGINGVVTSDFGSASDSASGLLSHPQGFLLLAGSTNGDALLARYQGGTSSVTVIKTIFRSVSSFDGSILEKDELGNTGGWIEPGGKIINVGDDIRDRQYIGILSFNTERLPDKAVITAARVKVKRQNVFIGNPFETHDTLYLDIRQGSFSNYVLLQKSDFNAPYNGQEIVQPVASLWYTVPLNTINKTLINKYGATQFRLRFALDDNDNRSPDYVKFFSGESNYRPQLILNYYVP